MEDGAKEQSSSAENSSMAAESNQDPKPLNHADLFKALEVVERDSLAISESYTSLFASLHQALSQVTRTTAGHIQCFNDAAGKLQESEFYFGKTRSMLLLMIIAITFAAIDATTRGNRFIHSCIRLNEEMKDIDALASELKVLKRNVDALDSTVNPLLRIT